MSIATILTALSADVENARQAIINRGGTVTPNGGTSQLSADIATIPQGGTQLHTVKLTANGRYVQDATDALAQDAPPSGTYVYLLTKPADTHPFFPESSYRFVMAIFTDGALSGQIGYRSFIDSSTGGRIAIGAPSILAYSYADDEFTRIEVA